MSTSVTDNQQFRLNQLRTDIVEARIDTLMVLVEENRRYLSGFTGEDTQFDESAGALFITPTQLLLATDSRFEAQAETESPLFDIYCYKKGLIKALPDIFGLLNTRKLGMESIRLSVKGYNQILEQIKSSKLNVELISTECLVEKQRLIKSEKEIDFMRKALYLAESVFRLFVETIEPGMTEKEAAWNLEKMMREGGAEAVSFPVIAASGPNAALPHAIPGKRLFKHGEPLLFDWGIKLNGYCSDISRTLILGKVDDTFQKVFSTVRDAQRKAIDAIKPGISSKEIDQIARDHIDKMGFKGRFGHGLGHGVGLAVHESPRVSPLKERELLPGMVFTVEPGIYLPGWGGVRLENMVLVTQDDVEVLNRLEIDLCKSRC
jgi:Xaa-Pro aminopeptidase